MFNFLTSCFLHFLIGIFLYFSFRGIELFLKILFKNRYKIFYSINLSIYFLASYLIFLLNKNFLIFFTILSLLFFLFKFKAQKIDINFFSLIIGLLCFSLYIGKLIHGPSTLHSAWGLFDTYYYVSSIYQDNVGIFNVKNSNIYGLTYPNFTNTISFLGNQFIVFEKFDGFYFLTISLLTFSILNLSYEISKIKVVYIKSLFIVIILIISFILALPYPLYFFESPFVLLALPVFPQIIISLIENKNNKYLNFIFIIFSLIISKIAILSIYFLTIFHLYRKNKKFFLFFVFILFLIFLILNSIIPLFTYFENFNFEILKINKSFLGLHKIFHIFLIISVIFFLKKNTVLFIYVPSIFIYIFFPQASPGQLFYLFFYLSLLYLFFREKFLKLPNLNDKYIGKLLILLFSIISFLSGFFIKVDFYLYFFYLFIFLLSFKVLFKRDIIFVNLIIFIFFINSFFNINFREDNVLNLNQKEIFLKIKELTPKNSLIFSDLNISVQNINPPWGLYSSISERQFYISSFYVDFTGKFSEINKKEMIKINSLIIENNMKPFEYFKNSNIKDFYILTDNSKPTNVNTDLIYQNNDFKILKFIIDKDL